jgi:hypothetical protein
VGAHVTSPCTAARYGSGIGSLVVVVVVDDERQPPYPARDRSPGAGRRLGADCIDLRAVREYIWYSS